MQWFVYMLECADGSIYTGSTNDIKARVAKHNSGKGAKYTRGRTPVTLKKTFSYQNKSKALKAEYAFKKLSHKQKQLLINSSSGKSASETKSGHVAGRKRVRIQKMNNLK